MRTKITQILFIIVALTSFKAASGSSISSIQIRPPSMNTLEQHYEMKGLAMVASEFQQRNLQLGNIIPPNWNNPLLIPSTFPSRSPTVAPSDFPTEKPSNAPSTAPTLSLAPSGSPTNNPTSTPSSHPSSVPTSQPTGLPTSSPSGNPTASHPPTLSPTVSQAPTKATVYIPIKLTSVVIDIQPFTGLLSQEAVTAFHHISDQFFKQYLLQNLSNRHILNFSVSSKKISQGMDVLNETVKLSVSKTVTVRGDEFKVSNEDVAVANLQIQALANEMDKLLQQFYMDGNIVMEIIAQLQQSTIKEFQTISHVSFDEFLPSTNEKISAIDALINSDTSQSGSLVIVSFIVVTVSVIVFLILQILYRKSRSFKPKQFFEKLSSKHESGRDKTIAIDVIMRGSSSTEDEDECMDDDVEVIDFQARGRSTVIAPTISNLSDGSASRGRVSNGRRTSHFNDAGRESHDSFSVIKFVDSHEV